MKPLTVVILLSLTVLLSSAVNKGVLAIKCYVCQSNVDPKCADPFDNLTLPITDCDAYPRADLVPKNEYEAVEEKSFFLSFGQPAPVKPLRASMCRKIRQKVNGQWRTIRGCGYLGSTSDSSDNTENQCHMRHGTYDIFMESCTCNGKDGCNAAVGSLRIDQPALLILIAAIGFLTSSRLQLQSTNWHIPIKPRTIQDKKISISNFIDTNYRL